MNGQSGDLTAKFFRLFLLITVLFLNCNLFSQITTITIHGKLISDENSTSNVDVVNLVNKESTVSNSAGEFFIKVDVGDLLIISGRNFEYKRYIIEQDDLSGELLIVKLMSKPIELEESLVYTKAQLEAIAASMTSHKVKKYTPAEGKLKTAGDFKPIHLLALLGGSLEVDPIINAITGKTARMKDELKIERKEIFMAFLEEKLGKDFFTHQLQIPEKDYRGFLFSVADNTQMISMWKSGDRNMVKFLLAEKAVKFKNANKIDSD